MKTTYKLFLGIAAVLPALTACTTPPPPEQKIPVAAKVKSFTATPAEVSAGDTATLEWSVEGATEVAISAPDGSKIALSDPKAQTGSVAVQVDESSVFVLTATGEGGADSRPTSVRVQADEAPIFFAAVPTEITAGESVALVWNASAAEVTIKDAAGTVVHTASEAAGTVSLTPSATTTYTVEAGGQSAQVEVTVSPAIFAFAATPTAGQPGQEVTLTWKVAGAGSVTLSSPGRGELVTVTDAAQIADGSFMDTIPAAIPEGGFVVYQLAATQGATTTQRELTVYAGVDPKITTFDVPEFAKAGGAYVVQWQTAGADRLQLSVDGAVVYVASSQAEVDSGTLTLPSPATQAAVELRVTNTRGGTAMQTATVTSLGAPTLVDFSASPNPLPNGGDPVTLSWNVTNARNVTILEQGGRMVTQVTGVAAEMGTVTVHPNKDVTYELQADNSVGEAITPATVAVTVTTPAKLTYSPQSMPIGAPVTISGSTVTGSGDIIGLPHGTVVKNATGEAFVDIKATGTAVGYPSDYTFASRARALPRPVPTQVYGQLVPGTDINVSINGWLTFESTSETASGDNTGTTLGTLLRPLAIAPYFDDLRSKTSGSEIYYRVDGAGLDERVIVQWDNVEHDDYSGSSLTFQAQIYASGKIVFAYKSIQGVPSTDAPAVGVVNLDESAEINPADSPAEGDTYTFFGAVTPPVTITAQAEPFRAFVLVPNAYVEIETTFAVIPPGQFGISEVNYNPATAKEEWFEVVNRTSTAFDLGGWDIDFGNSNVHTIAGSLILPPNGRLVFGQSADSAEQSLGGAAVDYVYGTAFSMPDAAGSVALTLAGGVYSSLAWTTAGTQGVSLQVGPPRPDLTLASGVTELSCESTTPYGSGLQKGTPGAVNAQCFPYVVAPVTGAFESILTTGTQVGTMVAGTDSDEVYATVTLPVPVNIAGYPTSTLYVSSNGFVSLLPLSSAYVTNASSVSSALPNGFLAPFWDDLRENTSGSGVYWQQFDPNSIGGDGDEYTLISWENWKRDFSTTSLNFQIRFVHATGDMEFHYGTMSGSTSTAASRAKGSSATTSLENPDGTAALVINVNSSTSPGIQPNSGFRFTYTP